MALARVDDLDGSPAQQVRLGIDGTAFALDLGEANRSKLLKALQPFLTVAVQYGQMPEAPEYLAPAAPAIEVPKQRPVKRAMRIVAEPVKVATPHATIRTWANHNGYQVPAKGRIPDRVIADYESSTRS